MTALIVWCRGPIYKLTKLNVCTEPNKLKMHSRGVPTLKKKSLSSNQIGISNLIVVFRLIWILTMISSWQFWFKFNLNLIKINQNRSIWIIFWWKDQKRPSKCQLFNQKWLNLIKNVKFNQKSHNFVTDSYNFAALKNLTFPKMANLVLSLRLSDPNWLKGLCNLFNEIKMNSNI